jgi:hypothetical protein
MARNSAVNLDITNNAVGATIGGGTTQRKITWNGSGDITLTQQLAAGSVFTFPNAATDNLIGSSAYTAAGTILYGSGAGTYPNNSQHDLAFGQHDWQHHLRLGSFYAAKKQC